MMGKSGCQESSYEGEKPSDCCFKLEKIMNYVSLLKSISYEGRDLLDIIISNF